ncbi:cytochrome c oxidase subunit II [Aurantimonas sp. VKM B-3413]|uniref:cytochrome c oxidase subunit II n=1 Tax=Aurantimonas sp. VKM B-3413 TaxID=2779401 RepID=UPI001E6006EA|nr:cytochrome c oxidase subunit II [Aurantimonas sp. VKM B-3413]
MSGLFLPIALAGCGGPQSTFEAAGTESATLVTLFWVMFAGAVFIWITVIGFAIYVTRTHPQAHDERSGQRLIVFGALFPTVVLLALLSWGLTLMPQFRGPAEGPAIAVSGERFWWRVAYNVEGEPGVVKSLPAGGVESANEIWLPVGRRTEILLGSPDVIHSFWIPALAGKTDAIPGRVNRIVLDPTRPGVFNGVCAEYCGDAHAQMGLRVVAVPPEEFDAHVRRQAEDAAVTSGRGAELFLKNGCGACHTVRGTPADGAVGPDLTHVASRRTIAAGLLPTNEANIAAFIRTPAHVKPGVLMPSFGMLPEDEIAAMANWLGALQ